MAINLNLSASKGLRFAIGLSSLLIATLSVSDSSAQSTEPLQSSTLVSNDVDEVPENAARNSPHVPPAPLPNPIAGQIQSSSSSALAIAAIPSDVNAGTMGVFGTPHNWPIMPIAMMLMPNGTVFAYGTDIDGKQDTLEYAVWNTAKAPDWDRQNPGASIAFKLLPNGTASNIFCSAQVHLLPNRALIIGGDVDDTDGFATNAGNNNVVVFESKINIEEPPSITNREKMSNPRWYPTAVTLPNRDTLVLGGQLTPTIRNLKGEVTALATYPPSTPEIRANSGGAWRTLINAGDTNGTIETPGDSAYGSVSNSWFYPRAWVDPRGKVFILTHSGKMFKLDTALNGTLTQYSVPAAEPSTPRLSSVMFAPGKILSLRAPLTIDGPNVAIVVDINATNPVVTPIQRLSLNRAYGSLTVLADGKVWANGGTSTPAPAPKNDNLAGANFDSEIWDPDLPLAPWKVTAKALYARLYHSSALLLPDGSVMTAGGGSPGPVTNLNGEIYYPPYLFNRDGTPAPRPTILSIVNGSSFSLTRIGWNRPMTITTGAGARNKINRITLVRAGAATHTFNNETRFFELPIPPLEVGTNVVTVLTPLNANVAPPGYYMVFMWNASGVPSVAKIIEIS